MRIREPLAISGKGANQTTKIEQKIWVSNFFVIANPGLKSDDYKSNNMGIRNHYDHRLPVLTIKVTGPIKPDLIEPLYLVGIVV